MQNIDDPEWLMLQREKEVEIIGLGSQATKGILEVSIYSTTIKTINQYCNHKVPMNLCSVCISRLIYDHMITNNYKNTIYYK